MTEEIRLAGLDNKLLQFFGTLPAECPYGLNQPALYHQASFEQLESPLLKSLIEHGYRRNGNCFYNMQCPFCSKCVPIRIRPNAFKSNRNQRRILKKNADISVEQAPLTMSGKNIALLDKFLLSRFPECRNQALSYYSHFFITTISNCFEIRYWKESDSERQLVGVAIVDVALDWANAVYFYFDPEEGWRSPGTYNILTLISLCQKWDIPFLYLGYAIDALSSMTYKKTFRPHELLVSKVWRQGE